MTRRAFTLIEVLLALTVVVILISTMATTVNVAWQSKRVAEFAIDSVRSTQAVGDTWVKDVANAVPPNPLSANPESMAYLVAATAAAAESADSSTTDTTGQTIVASGGIEGMNATSGITSGSYFLFGPFKGTNSSMNFYTTGPEPKAAIEGDVRYLEYLLVIQPDNSLALVRRVDTNLLGMNAAAQLPEEIIVTGVKAIKFTYYDGTNWSDAWDSTDTNTNNALPYAVAMELTIGPVREGGADRLITRYATIWCAGKSVNDSNYANAASEAAAATESSGTGTQ
jgi:prepilin-type N-terminal cleavage/methylation domain-containing protein